MLSKRILNIQYGIHTKGQHDQKAMELRDYQQRNEDAIIKSAQSGKRRILDVMPTGAGKTHSLASIALRSISKGNKVLCLMHRRGLVEQMMERFTECGIENGCIMAGQEHSLSSQCQIASLWTYSRRIKLADKEINKFWIDAPVILIDEAHHILSKTYQKVLDEYPNAFVIGVTATPVLSSGAGLGQYFDDMINVVSMRELLDGGHLIPGEYYGPSEPDLRKVPSLAGDWTKSGLDKELNKGKIIGDVVDNWMEIAYGTTSMVFAITRKHAKALCNEFISRGVEAEYLDSYSDDEDRSDVLRRLRSGDTKVVCQVALYTEGTDIPELETLVIARPTKSIGLHRQILGRGARPFGDQKSFMVLDHGGNVRRLGKYEDEIDWTLSDKETIERKKPKKKEKILIICDVCKGYNEKDMNKIEEFGVIKNGRCDRCGHEIKSFGKQVEAVQAELVPIGKVSKKTHSMSEKRAWYGMFEFERRRLGKNDKWLLAQYRSKFGVWPRKMDDVAPIEPSKDVTNWLTHQRIKWIKSKPKREVNK